jgi:AcrR family transcriptional regulator
MQDETKKSILKEARKSFLHFGYAKSSMNNIAIACGKKKSALYYYFPGKEELFEAVIAEEYARLFKKIQQNIDSEKDAEENLKYYIHTRLHVLEEICHLIRFESGVLIEEHPILEKYRKKSDIAELSLIENILQKGKENGDFDIGDIQKNAKAIHEIIKAIEIPVFLQDFNENMDEKLEVLLNILFKGVVKR